MNAKFLALLEEMEKKRLEVMENPGLSDSYKAGFTDGTEDFEEALEEILKSYGAFL